MLSSLFAMALLTSPVACTPSMVLENPQAASLHRVKPSVRRAALSEGSLDCGQRGQCKRAGYLVANDPVVVSHQVGPYACAWFKPAKAGTLGTVAWVRLEDVEPAQPAQSPRAWNGRWRGAQDQEIVIGPSAPDRLKVTGSATWAASAETAAMGAIHIGEIDGEFFVEGSRAEAFMDQMGPAERLNGRWGEAGVGCAVRMRLLGPYLLVQDNYQCGGHNVTFTGLYRQPG